MNYNYVSLYPIFLLGTPGVGKTRLCTEIAKKLKYNYVDVSAIAKTNSFILSHDEELDCPILDEEPVNIARAIIKKV